MTIRPDSSLHDTSTSHHGRIAGEPAAPAKGEPRHSRILRLGLGRRRGLAGQRDPLSEWHTRPHLPTVLKLG